ncbi:MAG: formyltransferase family protein [Nitrolancea sp.]
MSIDESLHEEHSQDRRPFKIVLFGRHCTQTTVTLRRLLREDVCVNGVLIPSSRDFGPAVKRIAARPFIQISGNNAPVESDTVDQLAHQTGIPIYQIRKPISKEVITLLEEFSPDLIVVSCFPWRVPLRVTQSAPCGAINVHPSLLPKFRGPHPLFWSLQTGATTWGVTVHELTDRLDSGSILRQRTFDILPSLITQGLEPAVSEIGAQTLVDAIRDIRSGNPALVEQDEASATYRAHPTNSDLEIRTEWTVERAVNFVLGAIQLGYRPLVATDRGLFVARSATWMTDKSGSADFTWQTSERISMRLTDGTIELVLSGELTG